MRILVVEDDKKIASFIVSGLRQAGFTVDLADNGESGLSMGLASPYDAAGLDLMLPKLGGPSVMEQKRRQKVSTPGIIPRAKRSVDDRTQGVQAGGDDYVI